MYILQLFIIIVVPEYPSRHKVLSVSGVVLACLRVPGSVVLTFPTHPSPPMPSLYPMCDVCVVV